MATQPTEKPPQNGTPARTPLEEDDEFEDFPVEDWPDAETEGAAEGSKEDDKEDKRGNAHLWEESWDDDDASEDFAGVLREEVKRVEAAKK